VQQLYYGTDQFAVTEFEKRKVIDEINLSMSAFNCVFADDEAIYCSSELTTGKQLYKVLQKHGVRSREELQEKLGAEEFKRVKKELFDSNVARGVQFAEELRKRGLVNVVTPGPYYAPDFTQQHYLYLWEVFIKEKAYEVRFSYDWQYSNGCTFEYAVAARKGIPRLDHEGNSIELATAIEKVEAAVDELNGAGFLIPILQYNLELLKAI